MERTKKIISIVLMFALVLFYSISLSKIVSVNKEKQQRINELETKIEKYEQDIKEKNKELKREKEKNRTEEMAKEKAELEATAEEEVALAATEQYVTPQDATYYEQPVVEQPTYSADGIDFKSQGVVYDENGTRYTYYSSNVAYHYMTPQWTPNAQGFYTTAEGYLVAASSDLPYGSIVSTPFGDAQILDSGCSAGTIDMYVNY